MTKAEEKDPGRSAKVEGSGAVAQDGGVAAGEGGVAVGRDVHGGIHIGPKVYTRSPKEELRDYLAEAFAKYEIRMERLGSRRKGPPDQPYKFLYAFEIEDADIFFGRGAAAEALHRTVLKDRLTIVHAKSGAGKTSLLNAGLSPRLIKEGRLPVYARVYDDPVRAIKRAIAPPSSGQWPELLDELTLQEFLGRVCDHLSRGTEELVIVLDQFEEFFVFWPERERRQPFIDALAGCYEDKELPIRIIVAVRKDYYSDLADLGEAIPTVFYNQYRLDPMTREEAQAAITGPVAKLGRPVTYEQALLDTLLDDLARGGMELPHLQIICTRLYDSLAENQTEITLDVYQAVGHAEGILSEYLLSVLNQLQDWAKPIAEAVLKELVSPEATKRVLDRGTLAARTETEAKELDSVLAALVDARLVHQNEVGDEATYELAHEYLADEIKGWIDPAELASRHAEELLAREVAHWRVHRTPIPTDRLEILYAQRERLRGLEAEALECLLLSALETDFAVEDWIELAGEAAEEILLAALRAPRVMVRRAATRGLGMTWEFPALFELGDEISDVRYEAARVLAVSDDLRAVEPLIAALADEASTVQESAMKALGALGDKRALEPLCELALEDEDSYVRRPAVEALQQLGHEDAESVLIKALKDEVRFVREAAATALGTLGSRSKARLPLCEALKDEKATVRKAAAEALGRLGARHAVGSLTEALEDESEDVREAAAKALGALSNNRAVDALIATLEDKRAKVRSAAAEALGRLGDARALEPLSAALGDPRVTVRRAAAEALGDLDDPGIVEALAVALRDEDEQVRESAIDALRNVDTGEARAALEEWRR